MISHTFFLANLPPWTTNGLVNFHLPHHLFCSKSPVGQWMEPKCKSTWGGYHLKSWIEFNLQSKLIQRFLWRNRIAERNWTIERCSLSQSTKFLLKVSSMRKAMLKNANNFAWILQFYFWHRRDFCHNGPRWRKYSAEKSELVLIGKKYINYSNTKIELSELGATSE